MLKHGRKVLFRLDDIRTPIFSYTTLITVKNNLHRSEGTILCSEEICGGGMFAGGGSKHTGCYTLSVKLSDFTV